MSAVPQEMALEPIVGEVEDQAQNVTLIATPQQMLATAVARGADLATLEKLMDLSDRWDAKQARNAYVRDMAEFKANPPTILKEKLVSFALKGPDGRPTGEKTEYKHATLGAVCGAIVGTLGAHGFSHRWDVKREGDRIHVTCTITHREGHSESVTLDGSPDTSGKKNALQQNASTVTYLQRYTLLAATGLATEDMHDDDGRGAGEPLGEARVERTAAEIAEGRRQVCMEAAKRHTKGVEAIKDAIGKWDVSQDPNCLYTAAEAWREIPETDQLALWLAPNKGGILTTHEREVLKTKLPRA